MADAKMTLDELAERCIAIDTGFTYCHNGTVVTDRTRYGVDLNRAITDLRALTPSIPIPQAELTVREVRALLVSASKSLRMYPLSVQFSQVGIGTLSNHNNVAQFGCEFSDESQMLSVLTRLATPPKPPKPETVTITIPYAEAVGMANWITPTSLKDTHAACREAVKEWL